MVATVINIILPSDLRVVKNGMLNLETAGLIFNFCSQICIERGMQTAPLVDANASINGSISFGKFKANMPILSGVPNH